MSLKPCKECGKEVSSSASKCPHCGASLRMGLFAKLGIGAVAAFALLMIIGANTPKYKIVAQERRDICREAAKVGVRTYQQCEDRYRQEIKEGQERGYK